MLILLCRDILFILMKPKALTEEQVFISDNLTFKQRPDLLINELGRLKCTLMEWIFPNKKNMICGCIYKHPSMKIRRFNSECLKPLLTNIQKEEKTFVDGWFQYKSLKYRNKHLYIRVPWQYAILFLWSLHPSTNKIDKKLKNTQTIFPKILLNSTFSGNLTSLISDYLP